MIYFLIIMSTIVGWYVLLLLTMFVDIIFDTDHLTVKNMTRLAGVMVLFSAVLSIIGSIAGVI